MLLDVLDEELRHTVHIALAEDIGKGDITAALVPEHQTAQATVISREPAIVCGMAWFNACLLYTSDAADDLLQV